MLMCDHVVHVPLVTTVLGWLDVCGSLVIINRSNKTMYITILAAMLTTMITSMTIIIIIN